VAQGRRQAIQGLLHALRYALQRFKMLRVFIQATG
jgi:hypothetical protein